MNATICTHDVPRRNDLGDDATKIPGHWLLAKLGKRVLRPGGLELTRAMLRSLDIQSNDSVIEFAPGLGITTQMALRRTPAVYTAVERDENAAAAVRNLLRSPGQCCLVGSAERTGLPSRSGSVVYGEAVLTMQGMKQKQQIVAEAFRLLKPGGRYGIHELCVAPNELPADLKKEIDSALSQSIHVGARPLTVNEWRELLESAGFRVQFHAFAPMRLLEPRRLIQDEGFYRSLCFVMNVLRNKPARCRILNMRRLFRKYSNHLRAVALVAVKPL